jgi:hypothetical protein
VSSDLTVNRSCLKTKTRFFRNSIFLNLDFLVRIEGRKRIE